MNINLRSAAACTLLAASLMFTSSASASQAAAAKDAAKDAGAKTSAKAATKAEKAPPAMAPTAKEIADAKAGGMVWVNLNTKVYHKDGEMYGTTKHGKFMSEADAQKAGNRAAKEPGAAKAKTPKTPKEPKK